MARKLTHKEKGFVKDILQGETGTQAALNNYDTEDRNTAAAIASENLTKPNIVNAIQDALPDDLLAERHLELLNKRDEYVWYEDVYDTESKNRKRVDVIPHHIDLGVDVNAVSKALDLAYKVKGSYAPEKSLALNVQVNLKNKQHVEELASKLLETLKKEEIA